jgi:YD repeat-containing protein
MDGSKVQEENTFDSIRQSWDGASKMISQRDLHDTKHFAPRISTPLGRLIEDSRTQKPKARDSMRESFDGVSNLISRRNSHKTKHFEHSIRTEFGMQMDDSDEQDVNNPKSS